MKIKHTQVPACETVLDANGNVDYYVDCNKATCASSSSHSAAESSQRNT